MKALEELQNTPMSEEDLMVERMNVIYGEDCELLSIPEFMKRIGECKFLSEPIPKTKIKGKYKINGHEYEVLLNPFEMNMGQYIDFKNINYKEPEKLFSIIFIPAGHKYNDGYDLQEVYNDMWSLPVPDVMAVNDFFFRLMKKYQSIIQLCLKREMKKMKKKDNREQIEMLIRIMDSYFTSLHLLD